MQTHARLSQTRTSRDRVTNLEGVDLPFDSLVLRQRLLHAVLRVQLRVLSFVDVPDKISNHAVCVRSDWFERILLENVERNVNVLHGRLQFVDLLHAGHHVIPKNL